MLDYINDILFFIGFIMLATGLWLINPAISLAVIGFIIMLMTFLRAGGDS